MPTLHVVHDDLDKSSEEESCDLSYELRIVSSSTNKINECCKVLFANKHALCPTMLDATMNASLCPNEIAVWDDTVHVVGNTSLHNQQKCHLPKIDLQFIAIEDCSLLRFY